MTDLQLKIPFVIILVDIVGTLAAGIGVADAIAGIKLIPAEYRFPYYNWILTGVGFLLISIHSIYMIKVYRSQSMPDEVPPRTAKRSYPQRQKR